MLAVTPFTKVPPKEYSRKLKAELRSAKRTSLLYEKRQQQQFQCRQQHSSSTLSTAKSFCTTASASSLSFTSPEGAHYFESYGNGVHEDTEDGHQRVEYDTGSDVDDEDGLSGNKSLQTTNEQAAYAPKFYNDYGAWRAKKAKERRHNSIEWLEQQHEKELLRRKKQQEDEDKEQKRQAARKLKKQADILAKFRYYEQQMAERAKRNEALQKQADRKIKKIDTLITLFQEWNIENHERAICDARKEKEDAEAAEHARQREEAIQRRAVLDEETKVEKEAERLLNKQVIQILRQTGACYPPQQPPRSVEEQIETASEVTVTLKPDLDKVDKTQALDLDLRKYRNAITLRGTALQTMGAVALAHQFFQGACPRLQTLDLTACGIHLAGFNRLILALRANTVPHVHTLLLSRNGLPAAVVGLLEGCLAAGGLGKLKYLDLRFNNLGDQGAQGFAHLLLSEKLEQLEVLLLQGNQIKFAGVNAIYRVSSAVTQTAPKLVEVNLLQNQAQPSKLRSLQIVEAFLKF